ncbi:MULTISPECIES: histidine kinase N-terminal 7TM domain-containing protein [unclassified Paenibacillus]|uniref:sensor histidine kinase n=1 Tax=unclassified Paenibacillus TaxID=185978 RepID=UPI002405E77A|nr:MULTISPECIES: histidine kinase N-terminal 7TM domain-containing protein [unclassified Paenibacillus]MDF9845309.1 signal transduction histidine kinase [Paenibacillus sp. PastF-2]MDF9851891.1 signal transduction histidine kinase [Paenibacillus sp. PastM-2]MDF9858455.1 signal transduction histidine kinase [Paenibacillus sp. PastF-1]MDH6483722.1 signal transduction histidine kinase [Paenibacillus sp. PastH-2]MDH6511104.1 signal transduction histidine kinase [Paenibacillus sp. PastM-3]
MSNHLYLSALLLAATCCSLMLVYLCWKRRSLPIAISYGLGMLTGSFYSLGYAFEISSTSLEQIRFWLRIEYLGIPFGTVLWFIMVLQYTGRQSWVNRRNVVLLMIVPVITFAAHNTNEWHHLFYTSITLDYTEGFPLAVLAKGPLYKLHVLYSYSFFVVGMVLLLQMFIQTTPRMKMPVALMIIGSWGPYGFTLVYLSGIIYMPIDISPFGFLVSGIFYIWGIYQFNMLRLAPLALQQVFGSMQQAVIVFDLDNVLTSFNRSAEEIIDGLNSRSIGTNVSDVFAGYPLLLECMMQEPFSISKLQLSSHAGNKFYHVQLSYIRNNSHKPAGKMLLLSDITDSVHTEERLLDNARQLSELNTFKDRMFSVVAHDIRDPVAVLVNLMEILEEDVQDSRESQAEVMEEMGLQIRNTFELVESLLEFFRTQTGGLVFQPLELDLAQSVEWNLRLMSVRSASKQIRIISGIPEETYVYADKEMLELIIRNLLSNAIKFTAAGGSIFLQAERKEQMVVVSVKDTGEGIAPEQAGTLLQEEYPVSLPGTAGERGIGLGLSLCREFVRLNGGEIWFDSAPPHGSTFYFSLPLSPASASDSGSRREGGKRDEGGHYR